MKDFIIDIDFEGMDFVISVVDSGFENRYHKAKIAKDLPAHRVKYSNAEKLAEDIHFENLSRYDCIVAGNFIFGDFIEAFVTKNNIKCEEMVISTLSMDQNNVDSLRNLLDGNYVDKLDLIVSDYFYAHERKTLIPYIYKELDINDCFQLAVAGSHTKIVLIKTLGGKKIVIHGSANLRSSSNIEQFTIEDNEGLYDFMNEYHEKIIDKYKTINKSVRNSALWDEIGEK